MTRVNNFDLMAAARRWPARSSGERFTLVILVSYMGLNEDGEWTAWPGAATLAEDTLQHAGTVRRHLAAFEKQGLVTTRTRQRSEGRGRRSNVLVLDVDLLTNRAQDAVGPTTNRAPGDDQSRIAATTNRAPGEIAPHIELPVEQPGELQTAAADAATLLPAPLLGFDEFWLVYPMRNGKRVGKRVATLRWTKLSLDDRRAAWRGARHYATACGAGLTIAKDAERFLRHRVWEDWQDGPGRADPQGGRQTGTAASMDAIRTVLAAKQAQAATLRPEPKEVTSG